MANIGINLVGVYKYLQGTPKGGLVPRKYSGTWGNRGQGNELLSALEKVLSQTGDVIINGGDYIGQGLAYLGGLLPGGLSAEEAVQNERNKQTAKKEGKKGFVNAFGKYEYFPIYGVAPDVNIAKMPGWQLKGLMRGSQLEKLLSKAGTININGLLAHLNKASKLELDIIGRILSDQFAGLKNIDYNALRKAVLNELITYSRKPLNKYSTYGMDKLGFDKKQELDGVGGVVDYVPGVKTLTFTFESPRVPGGDGRHYDETTLGHSRTYTTPDEPEILHVMESLSDWGLSGAIGDLIIKRNKYLQNPQIWDKSLQRRKQEIESFNNMINTGINDMGEKLQPYAIKLIQQELLPASMEKYNKLKEVMYPSDDLVQQKHLSDNYIYRQLQENMKFAAENKQSLMRYPTRDTAVKIEGFEKLDKSLIPEIKKQIRKTLLDFEDGYISEGLYKDAIEELNQDLKRLLSPGDYSSEQETILKKYSDFPKMFNKLFKGLEVRTVTDPKGNTWYEVDIPENFLLSEWLFRKGGVLGLNKIFGL